MAAQEFTCFPELPLELRRLVWGYASNFPREVDIKIKKKGTGNRVVADPIVEGIVEYDHYSSTAPPAVLSVSCEARGEALRFYTTYCGNLGDAENAQRQIYINFRADRIHFVRGNFVLEEFFGVVFAAVWHHGLRRVGVNLADMNEVRQKQNKGLQRFVDLAIASRWLERRVFEEVVFYYCVGRSWREGERRELFDVGGVSDAVTKEMKDKFENEIAYQRRRWSGTMLQRDILQDFVKWPGILKKEKAHHPVMKFMDVKILYADT